MSVETVVTSPDNILYLQDEAELCQVKELVDGLLNNPRARDYLLVEAKEEHVWFEFVWEPPSDHEGRPLYMKKIDPEAFRPVECLRVVGPCKVDIGRFGMRHGQLGGVKLAWGKTTIAGRDTLAVATITPGGEAKLSVNFSGPAQE